MANRKLSNANIYPAELVQRKMFSDDLISRTAPHQRTNETLISDQVRPRMINVSQNKPTALLQKRVTSPQIEDTSNNFEVTWNPKKIELESLR
jgi:hypothetical protein